MAKSLFEQLGGTYHEENGYFIPDLRLTAEEKLILSVLTDRRRNALKGSLRT